VGLGGLELPTKRLSAASSERELRFPELWHEAEGIAANIAKPPEAAMRLDCQD
jgi:hypothetical protein